MDRRTLLTALAAIPVLSNRAVAREARSQNPNRLVPPAMGKINVAVLLSEGATVIDFCGPWEVFVDVAIGGHTSWFHQMPFRLYTVAETDEPIRATGGMRIIPDYTLAKAPPPHVVVIPAQQGQSEPMLEWIRSVHDTADIVLSVCTGAFLLAATGLLNGKPATTHHDYYDLFRDQFPDVELRTGLRFVEHGKLMTAGGLSSGIDAALRIVERYFGREVAQETATYMEYQGTGWKI